MSCRVYKIIAGAIPVCFHSLDDALCYQRISEILTCHQPLWRAPGEPARLEIDMMSYTVAELM